MKRINNYIFKLSAVITVIILSQKSVYADQLEDAANNASEGISNTAVSVLKPILTIGLFIVGFTLIFSSRGKETVKENIGKLLGGTICILFAGTIVASMLGWFGR